MSIKTFFSKNKAEVIMSLMCYFIFAIFSFVGTFKYPCLEMVETTAGGFDRVFGGWECFKIRFPEWLEWMILLGVFIILVIFFIVKLVKKISSKKL